MNPTLIERQYRVKDLTEANTLKGQYLSPEDLLYKMRSMSYSELQKYNKIYIRIVDQYDTLLYTVYSLEEKGFNDEYL